MFCEHENRHDPICKSCQKNPYNKNIICMYKCKHEHVQFDAEMNVDYCFDCKNYLWDRKVKTIKTDTDVEMMRMSPPGRAHV